MSNDTSSIPVTLTLGTSLDDREVTNEKVDLNYCIRTLIEKNDERCVSSFLKTWATDHGVHWLYSSFLSQKGANASHSACDSAVVTFGNGDAIGVRVRQTDAATGTSATSQAFGFTMKLFIMDGDSLVLLRPHESLYQFLRAKESAQDSVTRLFACPGPNKVWESTLVNEDSVRNTITFSVRNNDLQSIDLIKNDSHPVVLQGQGQGQGQAVNNINGSNKKRKKDKNKPKNALTAYSCFHSKNYKQVKSENPGMSFPDITRLIGAKWQNISPQDRKTYEILAEEDKARFESEMANYTPPSDDEEGFENEKPAKKKKKDPNRPKTTKSAYLFFCDDMREKLKEENPDLTFKDTGKELGKRYRALTPKQKEKYDKLCEKDKVRYEGQMKVYNGGGEVEVEAEAEEVVREEEEEEEKKEEDEAAEPEVEAEEVVNDEEKVKEEEEEEAAEPESEEAPQSPVKSRRSRRKQKDKTPHDSKPKAKKQSTKKKRKKKSRSSSVGITI